MNKQKKGISPVIAVSLLIVVTVVAVVGFQSWYTNYQSQLTSDVETRSTSTGNINIEYIGSDGILYVINSGTSNTTMISVDVGGVDCSINEDLAPGVNKIDISSCLSNVGTNDVVIVTDSGIVEKSLYIYEIPPPPPLDCSSLGLVGGIWITVPGNSILGTSDFCVMKYEAKNVGGVATSQAASLPWNWINYTNSKNNCSALGVGYHLITDLEWVTIARNIENVDASWSGGSVGTGVIFSGNTGVVTVGSYNAAFDPVARDSDVNFRAKLTLSNDEEIWDFAGNVYEWTDYYLNTTATENASLGHPGPTGWYDWNLIIGYDYLKPANLVLDVNDGIGQVALDIDLASGGAEKHAFHRGGGYGGGNTAGIHSLFLMWGLDYTHTSLGFRCVYTP